MIKLIIFSQFISSLLLDLILFEDDFCKIYGLDFDSICKLKLGFNKYFSWSLLNTTITIYFKYLYFKKEESKYFRSFYIYYTTNFLKILLFQIKKPFGLIAKGLEIVWLPLLESFGTFKDEIVIDYSILNQLVFQ